MSLNLFVNNFQFFLLVFLRIAATLFVAPVFASMLLRPRMKVFIAFFVALIILLPVKEFYAANGFTMPVGMIDYGLALVNEIIVGLAIGFFLGIIFSVFQLAGQLFSIQIGFGISEVIDPLSQIQIPLIGQFQAMLGTLVFFAIDGHLMLFQGLMYSFKKLPVINMMNLTGEFFSALKWAFVVMFATALKIGLPIMGSLFLVTLCMGLLAKAAPQMNILMLGFPIYIFVGFTTISYLMPNFIQSASQFLRSAFFMLFKFFAS